MTRHRQRPNAGAGYPALTAWRDELRRGERTPTTFDALWQAACCEANAQEFEFIPELHERFLQDAQAIIRREAHKQRQQRRRAS